MAWVGQQLPNLDPKDLLPLGIDIQTGAIILGNQSTPELLVAEFQHAFGTYGIVTVSGLSRNKLSVIDYTCSLDQSMIYTSRSTTLDSKQHSFDW